MFNEKLKDLMQEKKLKAPQLAMDLGIKTNKLVYNWLNGVSTPKLSYALKLRDYFSCSLDYLFGNSDYEEIKETKQINTFNNKLKEILKNKKITQTKLLSDLKLSNSNSNSWHKQDLNPRMDTIVKLANYLNVSIDYLVGIE